MLNNQEILELLEVIEKDSPELDDILFQLEDDEMDQFILLMEEGG